MASRFCEVIGPTTASTPSSSTDLARRFPGDVGPVAVVAIDDLDGPPKDPAGCIDVGGRQLEPELGLRAVELDAAGERQHGADLDRIGGLGMRGPMTQGTIEPRASKHGSRASEPDFMRSHHSPLPTNPLRSQSF